MTNFVFLQFSGPRPWHMLLHTSHDYEEKYDCVTSTFASPEGNTSSVTVQVYDTRWVHDIHNLFTAICDDDGDNV
jgi:hypothetical protein